VRHAKEEEMDDVKKILAVSRSTPRCARVVRYGVSLARKYSAELCVIRVVHDPFNLEGWNLPIPPLQDEYEKVMEEEKAKLDRMLAKEKAGGLAVKEFVREGKPVDEILRVVAEERIDLLLLLAHEEGRLEHFLFGRTNDELVRRIPCSLFLLKSVPTPECP
jgi:nucleotide-binding universal stress UspA family protein